MIISHKIRIYPNKEQEVFLKKSCGVARFAYNWGLAEWERQYKTGGKPNYLKLKKQFNGIKQAEFPFVCEVSKCCAETAFANLGRAYKNFFDRRAKYPKFKKKGVHDSFGLDNLNFQIEGNHIKLAKMQPMLMAEPLRFDGKIMSGTVSCVADKWYISIAVEVKKDMTLPKTGKYVGVDLGVKDIAITSDGFKFANPRWIQKSEKKLKRLQRELARRQRASKRRERTRLRLARQHNRITNQRKDWLHKLTTFLVRNYDVISLEDLNVRGMTKNHSLAKAITNVAFGEFKRQIEYKAQMYGKQIYRVDRFFPSSKTCSVCGCIQDKMPLHIREWTCPECGAHHDRDINAATNLLRQAMPEVTHGERLALVISEISDITKLDSLNRETYKIICYERQLITLAGVNEPLLEMADIMSRDQNYGFLITVFSNDHNPPHAHVLDLDRKDMGQIEITNEAPKTVEDICLYRTVSLPLKVKKSIVEWANKTDPDFNCPYWVTLKNFWKRFQASN